MAGKRKRGSEEDDENTPSGDTQETAASEPQEETPKKSKKTTKKKDAKETKKSNAKKASSSASSSKAPAKKGAKPAVIKSESEAKRMISEYMISQNRPYNLQQIIDNLGGQIKKAMATKCVDKLEQEGVLILKANGKQKLWYRTQEGLEVLSKEELKEIDTQIKASQKELALQQTENHQLSNQLSRIRNAPTTDSLHSIIAKEREDLQRKKDKLEKLESGSVQLVTPEEKKQAMIHLDKYLKEWKKRRGIAKEMMDQILDSGAYEGPKPHEILEEIGIETDESLGVDMKTIGKLSYDA